MEQQNVIDIIATLGNHRRLFWYFPGRFAHWLLADAAGTGMSIKSLQQQPVGRLLQRPDVKPLLARCGDGMLRAALFNNLWHEHSFPLVMVLDSWGGSDDPDWYQTSHPGYNLVLRFDLAGDHMAELRRRFGDYDWLFNCSSHPVAFADQRPRETLAWVRLDINLEDDEVLIEEVQSDWVRDAQAAARYGWRVGGKRIPAREFKRYRDEAFKPLQTHWADAALGYSLQFIRNELGVRHVYYHDSGTGTALKGMHHSRPPRSLYEDLPKRFCMWPTDDIPVLLHQHSRCRRILKKIRPHRFFKYQLNVGTTNQ